MVIAPHDQPARLIVSNASIMLNAKGQTIGAVASMQDVTEERNAARKIAAADAKYRAIFDHTFQFCALLSTDGAFLEVNQTALNFGGFTLDAIAGKLVWDAPWWSKNEIMKRQVIEAVKSAAAGSFVRYEVNGRGGTAILCRSISR